MGITGSVGKTTTKQFVAAALGGEEARCVATPGNANNEIGLPLALLNLPDGTERFVAEMGMYTMGDIRDLCAIADPRIGIVTAVDAVHAERAGSLDAIESAKGELVEALPDARAGGVAVLNADDERVARMAERTRARVVTYGIESDADVVAEEIRTAGRDGTRFPLRVGRERIAVTTRALGRHSVYQALPAAAVAREAGLTLVEIAAALAIPVGTVKSRIARGRAQLARHLGIAPGNRDATDRRPTEAP